MLASSDLVHGVLAVAGPVSSTHSVHAMTRVSRSEDNFWLLVLSFTLGIEVLGIEACLPTESLP